MTMLAAADRTLLLPLSRWHAFLVDVECDPACDDLLRRLWVLSYGVMVRPRVDLRRLRRALDKLVARHDSLRLRIVRAGSDWRAAIAPPGPAILREVDLGEPDEATMLARLRAIATAPMPLVDAPLAETVVVHCGRHGDAVVTRVHHAVADGFGMLVLIEDQLKFLLGLPVLTPALGHAAYLRDHHDLPPDRARAAEAFWDRMTGDMPTAPLIGRRARGLQPLTRHVGHYDPAAQALPVTEASRARVAARAEALGLGVPVLYFAAFLEAICAGNDIDRIALTAILGRIDPALATFIGDAHFSAPLTWRATGARGFEAGARRFGADLLAAMEHLPHDIARDGTPARAALQARGIDPDFVMVRENGAAARERKSPFAAALGLAPDGTLRFGSYSFTRLDLYQPKRGMSEVAANVHGPSEAPGVTLTWDRLAFDEAEVAAIGERLFALLDLDPAPGTG